LVVHDESDIEGLQWKVVNQERI